MTHFPSRISSSLSLAALLIAGIGCNPSGLSVEEKTEFRAVLRALDALSSAPEQDRGVRLDELRNVSCKTERISALKKSCVDSYREFENASRLLADARAKTAQTEAAVARARKETDGGQPMGLVQKDSLLELSQSTAQSLEAVNTALNKAESLVEECEKKRKALEQLVTNR